MNKKVRMKSIYVYAEMARCSRLHFYDQLGILCDYLQKATIIDANGRKHDPYSIEMNLHDAEFCFRKRLKNYLV